MKIFEGYGGVSTDANSKVIKNQIDNLRALQDSIRDKMTELSSVLISMEKASDGQYEMEF